ncbi:hypothetical protein BST61_g2146 [Cercospora zeina]
MSVSISPDHTARLLLDELNLKVIAECAKYLRKYQEAGDKIKANLNTGKGADHGGAVFTASRLVAQLYARFGHIFACSFQLGGQLTASNAASSLAEVGLCRMLCGSSVDDKTRDVDVKNTSSLIWSARGGKSLLCANPAAWANAVADPRNLLVMEQANMVALPELVSKLELSTDIGGRPWHTIGDTFSTIANNKFKEIPRVLPGTWTGKLKFETLDGGKVVTKDNQLCVSDPDEGTIFYIVDAEMKRQGETDPQMPQLYADHPIFLIPGKTYARQSSAEGGQSAGLWVDPKSNDEKIRTDTGNTCAMGTRSDGHPAQRRGRSLCHSHHSGGSFTSINLPPWFAPYVVKKASSAQLQVFKLDQNHFSNYWAFEQITKDASWAFPDSNRASMQSLIQLSDLGQTSQDEDYPIRPS